MPSLTLVEDVEETTTDSGNAGVEETTTDPSSSPTISGNEVTMTSVDVPQELFQLVDETTKYSEDQESTTTTVDALVEPSPSPALSDIETTTPAAKDETTSIVSPVEEETTPESVTKNAPSLLSLFVIFVNFLVCMI